jgi:hypothetical protein
LSLREKLPLSRNQHVPAIVLESAHPHFGIAQRHATHGFDGVDIDGGDSGRWHGTLVIQK